MLSGVKLLISLLFCVYKHVICNIYHHRGTFCATMYQKICIIERIPTLLLNTLNYGYLAINCIYASNNDEINGLTPDRCTKLILGQCVLCWASTVGDRETILSIKELRVGRRGAYV